VIDYNNGVLLPFTPITTAESIYGRLRERSAHCIDIEARKKQEEEEEIQRFENNRTWRSERWERGNWRWVCENLILC
jgi:hypothetical protein